MSEEAEEKSQLFNGGNWIIAKPLGSIRPQGNSMCFRYKNHQKSFLLKNHGYDLEEVKKAAISYQIKYNEDNGLETKNNYCYLSDEHVLVKLDKGFYMLMDSDNCSLTILSLCVWSIEKKGKNFYAKGTINGKILLFHRAVMFMEDEHYFSIDHKNGTLMSDRILDNTRSNLRWATPQAQANNRSLRVDNKSGFNGVNHSTTGRAAWIFSYARRDGKYEQKAVPYGLEHECKYSYQAKAVAIMKREAMNKITGCLNGKPDREGRSKESRELEKRLKVNVEEQKNQDDDFLMLDE